jgi:hypothetical protein
VREIEGIALELRRQCERDAPQAPLLWRPHYSCCLHIPVPSLLPEGVVVPAALMLFVPAP